jgi:hypothetical protein
VHLCKCWFPISLYDVTFRADSDRLYTYSTFSEELGVRHNKTGLGTCSVLFCCGATFSKVSDFKTRARTKLCFGFVSGRLAMYCLIAAEPEHSFSARSGVRPATGPRDARDTLASSILKYRTIVCTYLSDAYPAVPRRPTSPQKEWRIICLGAPEIYSLMGQTKGRPTHHFRSHFGSSVFLGAGDNLYPSLGSLTDVWCQEVLGHLLTG